MYDLARPAYPAELIDDLMRSGPRNVLDRQSRRGFYEYETSPSI